MTRIPVRFYELDPYGHVNHGIYLNYFEVARIELLDRFGLGLLHLKERGFQLVVVEAHARFHAPAVGGDVLEVESEVREVRPASSRWHQSMWRGEESVATLDLRTAITDLAGRPSRAPADLRRALEDLRATRGDEASRRGGGVADRPG